MKITKISLCLILSALLLVFSGCGASKGENTISPEGSYSGTVLAMVSKVDGSTITANIMNNMSFGNMPSQNGQSAPNFESFTDFAGGNGEMPQMPQEGANPGQMPGGMPEGFDENAGMTELEMPAEPDFYTGATENASGTDFEKGEGFDPGTKIPFSGTDFPKDGNNGNEGNKGNNPPSAFPGGGQTVTITLGDASVLNGIKLSDIKEGTMLEIVFDDSGKISKISQNSFTPNK